MTLGALLASGDANELLPAGLLDCLLEVRVEQFLDRPTQFAVRFQEDLSAGEPRIAKAPELEAERMFSIVVPVKEGRTCLVRGPITEVRGSFMLGGPGSWFEIRGEDRRVELDRQCFRHAWEGRASEVAERILSFYRFEAKVEQTNRVYSERDGTLNQRGSDLAFLNRIATLNNLAFWLDYECGSNGLDPTGQRLEIRERAHLEPSPPRPADSSGAAPGPADVVLSPTTDLRLRVNVSAEQCQNVTSFELEQRTENPNRFEGTALNDRDVRIDRVTAEDRQPPVRRDGRTLRDLTGQERVICVTAPGDQQELQPRGESAMTHAGWFLTATASTTAHMLGGVLVPHDVIEVDGLGRRHSGAYQIESVTHVINAADHRMDFSLRRNAVGRD